MRVAIRRKEGQLPNGTIKIGAVARHFGISVDLLRLYEREGLLIPLKSPRGTRYFTEHDYPWISTILRLVREARLNFAGIRRLLALLPCWEIRKCGHDRRVGCPVFTEASQPCWTNRICCHTGPVPVAGPLGLSTPPAASPSGQKTLTEKVQECYFCAVYRSAPSCENLKALLVAPPELSRQAVPGFE
jgi:MerR family transcriptional regulator/heat shock protein HspR